ncbi:hypothetical protein NP493_35g02013 [Ridgeia piscesae]|uniref:Uncharacterized protein n=1 Tax=Ridgeia piscesae TaxID=27915 RepID=A0AAD9PCS4_RIDPI|nr:hypothetical protein NP493_35g02013 [Ridgeia piscesae]
MFDNSKITEAFQPKVVHCDYTVGALRLRGWTIATFRLVHCNQDIPEYVHGLSTHDALQLLREELVECIDNYEAQQKSTRWTEKLGSSFLHHSNVMSVLPWTSIAVVIVCVVLLIVAYAAQPQRLRDDWLVVEALLLLLILVVNVYFLAWDDSLRQKEMANKARQVLAAIEACYCGDVWTPQEYINLYCPLSPSVSLQWTMRDGHVVNLPTSFLVKGDVILLRPGHVVPATCDEIQVRGHRVRGHRVRGHRMRGHRVRGHRVRGHGVRGYRVRGHKVRGHGVRGHRVRGHGVRGHGVTGHGVRGHRVRGHRVRGHGVRGHGVTGHGVRGHRVRGDGVRGHGVRGHGVRGHGVGRLILIGSSETGTGETQTELAGE